MSIEGESVRAALEQARRLVARLEVMAKGKPTDPFLTLLGAKVTEYLYRVAEPRSTRQVARGVAEAMGRHPKTLEQVHLGRLAAIGFPHCRTIGKRVVWQYERHRIQDTGA